MLLVTGCNMELQKSANNKLFDTKGFDKNKRKPIYNDKYIDRAKRNIVDNNFDDDEDMDVDEPDEYVDPYTKNRIMYSNMIKKDQKKRKSGDYPNIGHARDLAKFEDKSDTNADLRKELDEIKSMLSSAKKDLAKYKCPLQPEPVSEPQTPPKPKKHIKKLAPPEPPVKHDEEDGDYGDDTSDDTDTNADHAAMINPVAAHPALAPAPALQKANMHEVSEQVAPAAAPAPAMPQHPVQHPVPVQVPAPVVAPQPVVPPVSATPVVPAAPVAQPSKQQPLSSHTKASPSGGYHEVDDDISNGQMSVIPAAPGSEHGMINLAPGK